MKEAIILDITMHDYFTGFRPPILSCLLFHEITCEELAEEIRREIDLYGDTLKDDQLLAFEAIASEYEAKGNQTFWTDPDNALKEAEPDDYEWKSYHLHIGLAMPIPDPAHHQYEHA